MEIGEAIVVIALRDALIVQEYPKNGNRTYRILYPQAYIRFWWGRKPSTKKAYEEWLTNEKETMRRVANRNGKTAVLLQRINGELRAQGILEVVRTNER